MPMQVPSKMEHLEISNNPKTIQKQKTAVIDKVWDCLCNLVIAKERTMEARSRLEMGLRSSQAGIIVITSSHLHARDKKSREGKCNTTFMVLMEVYKRCKYLFEIAWRVKDELV
jgi:hypothetical protein